MNKGSWEQRAEKTGGLGGVGIIGMDRVVVGMGATTAAASYTSPISTPEYVRKLVSCNQSRGIVTGGDSK